MLPTQVSAASQRGGGGRGAGLGILASEWQESVFTLWDLGFRISSSAEAFFLLSIEVTILSYFINVVNALMDLLMLNQY